MMTTTAKIVREEVSQAVILPKGFHFEGDEVCVKRVGTSVLLYPKGAEWDLMEQVIGNVDDDFLPRRGQPTKSDKRKQL